MRAVKKRTLTEVGHAVRRRRESLGLTQEGCGVSSSLVKQIEKGEAPGEGRGSTRSKFMRALRWPPDALERLAAGADPHSLEQPGDPPISETPPWEDLLAGQRKITEALERLAEQLEDRP